MTSDEFFEKYPEEKFDVIFIDGLHHYDQCQKDTINALKKLNESVAVELYYFMIFYLGQNWSKKIPQNYGTWSGDVWKVAVELYHSKNMNFKICNIDRGVGILKPSANYEYFKMPELKDAGFDLFLSYLNKFPIVGSEEALDFIDEEYF